jgi:hypothetical protein
VFSGKPFYEKHFTFKETLAINPTFDNAGFSDQNYLLNSGSFTIMIVVIIMFSFLKWSINRIFAWLLYKYKENEIIMKIGKWGFDEEYA